MASRRGAEHAANIMEALAGSERPLSAYDLLDRLRPTGVAAPLTVYRALDKLIASGKVHRIESLNAYVACREGGHHHVHAGHEPHGPGAPEEAPPRRTSAFAICDRCGTVDEFVDEALFDRLDRELAGRRFAPRASAIEVHGLCGRCAAGPPDEAGARH